MVRRKKEDSSELHSSESLGNSVARIEQLLVPVRRVADEMARLKTGPISIGNHPSFLCALADLSRWGKACEDAFTMQLMAMGHFKARVEFPPQQRVGKEKKSRR